MGAQESKINQKPIINDIDYLQDIGQEFNRQVSLHHTSQIQSPSELVSFLSPPQSKFISIFDLQSTLKGIESLKQTNNLSKDQFDQLSHALFIIRSFNTKFNYQRNHETDSINFKIKFNVIKITCDALKINGSVQLAFQTNLIAELIDLANRNIFPQITLDLAALLYKIADKCSSEQNHLMVAMGIFFAISSKLKNNFSSIQQFILKTIKSIIKSAWKLNSPIQLSQSNSSVQQSQSNSSSNDQSNLLQLLQLSTNHPYHTQLDQQGLPLSIIQNILLKNGPEQNQDSKNKRIVFDILDSIYLQGIKLPVNYQESVIGEICSEANSINIDSYENAYEVLSMIAINSDNHKVIIDHCEIKQVAEQIINQGEFYQLNWNMIKYQLNFILNLFIFGSDQTKQFIQNSIPQQKLQELDSYYRNNLIEAEQLQFAFSHPDTMMNLFTIRRIVDRKSQDEQIELIKAGLLQNLNQIIQQAILEDEFEKIKVIIVEIILILIQNNEHTRQVVIEDSDFIDQNIQILNTLTVDKTQIIHFDILSTILSYISNNQLVVLFSKGVIQSMIRFLASKDILIRQKMIWIVIHISRASLEGLKEGEQHPFLQTLSNDGTIDKLIHFFSQEKAGDIHKQFIFVLTLLFKAFPLAPSIKVQIITELQLIKYSDIDQLALIAECQDNHQLIFDKKYFYSILDEDLLYESKVQAFSILKLIFALLKFGTYNSNKIMVCQLKQIENKTSDEFISNIKEDQTEFQIYQPQVSKGEIYEKLATKLRQVNILISEVREEEGEYEDKDQIQFIPKKNLRG